MRKQAFADQCLCFRFTDSRIYFLNPKFQAFNCSNCLLFRSVAENVSAIITCPITVEEGNRSLFP